MEERWCSPKSLTAATPWDPEKHPRGHRGLWARKGGRPAFPIPEEPHPQSQPQRSRVSDYSAFDIDFDAPAGPDDVAPISDNVLGYIESGHAHGAGLGKDEFPEDWVGDVLREKVQQVVDNPQAIRPNGADRSEEAPTRARLFGLVDGISMVVVVEKTDQGWYPWYVQNSHPRDWRV